MDNPPTVPVSPATPSPATPTFFGVDPTQISDSQGQTFYKAWQAASQSPTSQLSQKFQQGVQSGAYNDMANAAGIDTSKFPQIFPTPNLGQRLVSDTNANAADMVDTISQGAEGGTGAPTPAEGAVRILGDLGKEVGDLVGEPISSAYSTVVPDNVKDTISKGVAGLVKMAASTPTPEALASGEVGGNNTIGTALSTAFDKWNAENPNQVKDTEAVGNIIQGILAAEGVQQAGEGVLNIAKNGVSTISDIAGGGGSGGASPMPPPINPSNEEVWNMVQPKLSADELNQAARTGAVSNEGIMGKTTLLPNATHDADMISTARAYIKPNDPIASLQNLNQAVANEATNLRSAVGEGGGTWSTSNYQGVADGVKVPLAIKDSAEMTQVNNIKDYVVNLADKAEKTAGGALDVAQGFRQGINSEFGENVWGKGTPIASYIRNMNKALNDFIPNLLPDGTLPDGTTIADSFKKQTLLYNAMDNIQVPKLGSTNLSRWMASNPMITKLVKSSLHAAGMGAAVGATENLLGE